MKRLFASAAVSLLVLTLSVPALSQGFFATVAGTVTDTTGALIPGVTVKATGVDTGVVTNTITNESGAYSFGNLLPGKYTIGVSLPGFQAKTLTDVQLSANTPYRYNFELAVASVNTQVEVTVSADTILATQGATVGQVLNQQKVQDLPLVGNNILDLITVMAGVENIIPTNPPSAANAFGRNNTTFAGVRADNISVVRDGIQMQDNRNPNGIYSVTTINPDLVGEIRLILAPVDPELGRGNGSIQYTTRSGTNRFAGSAVWSVRNTALDPNTWQNKTNQSVPENSPPGTVPVALRPNWTNTNQVTVSYGGPIIRNKTFFFALVDVNRVKGRHLSNVTVPTACARLGIFRYFNGWTNDDFNGGADGTGSNADRVSVNVDGSPKPPTGLPVGSTINLPTPYDNSLQSFSVFGRMTHNPTANDCSDAPIDMTTLVPHGVTVTPGTKAGGAWDPYRQQLDTTGYIKRVLDIFPMPNNWETGDGLNTAGYRFLRSYRGVDNLFGSGEATGDREQYNVKIDHNFTSNHKGNFNISYELVDSDDVFASLPHLFSNLNYRRPMVLSGGFTSTLSPSVLNEARFGMRRQGINVVAPWHLPESRPALEAILPSPVDGIFVLPNFTSLGLCNPHSGSRPPGSGCVGVTGTQYEKTPTLTFSDTVSWTKGAHAFRFNGEVRLNSSETRNPAGNFGSANSTFLTVHGNATNNGATPPGITGTMAGTNSATDFASANPAMVGLTTTSGTNGRLLMNYLAGSLTNIQTLYYLSDPNNTSTWGNFHTGEFITVKAVTNEFTAWAKDDWKITRNLTITPGVRWDYFGTPYIDSGLTIGLVGGGAAAFGVSGRDFTGWMRPGVRADVTSFELVGPNSPNPDKSAYKAKLDNIAPTFSFAWNVPWFGEGKTVVRGGYGITYQGRGFGTVAGALSTAPGTNFAANFSQQNVYLDLASLNPSVIPVPNVGPLQPLLTTGPRTATFTAFDPNYTSPYVQNLTLSVTRSITNALTADVRYVGTMSRKLFTTLNLNTNNFLYNGLLESLDGVRTGTEITKAAGDPLSLLDQMFQGINLCTSGCTAGQPYGAIGQTVGGVYQTAAYQMRSSTTFNTNLANADYNAIATTINTLNYSTTGSNASLPPIPPNVVGAAMRLNGFPDNFIRANPQFGTMNLLNNNGHSNYHSLQTQLTMRPIHGLSGSVTYNWSKNLGLLTNFTNPVHRSQDYTNIGGNPAHSLRTYGTIELPIGPNKLLMGNSSGLLARFLERWQLGLIYNLSSGAPTSITATTMLYGNGLPDVVRPVDFNKIKGVRWGIPAGTQLEGRYFDNNDLFVKVDDPSCFNVTAAQNLNGLNPAPGATANLRCTLNALAMVVPAGTPDSQVLNDGRTVQVILQHPKPGTKGNLGNNTVIGMGTWRFDANLSKTFRISESKSVALRIDMQNVLNHPVPEDPNFSITGNDPFGQIEEKGNQTRLLQGQIRINF